MELKIKDNTYTPIVVENFDEIKAMVQDKADHYKHMTYTEEQLPEAKKDKATLNKFVKAIEDRRKEVKKACMQPYESFETQIKELVAICNEPIKAIDEFVKAAEAEAKEAKRAEIEKLFSEIEHPDWLNLNQIFNSKWLNQTVKMSLVEEEIKSRLKATEGDIKTISTLECSFEAMEEYKRTLSLADAIREGQRIADIQKRKEEKSVPDRESPKSDEEKPMPDYSAEQKQWIGFKVYITPSEARELKAWLIQKGIEIRA